MGTGSKIMFYTLLSVVVLFGLLLIFAAGPLGWGLLVVGLLIAGFVRLATGTDETAESPDRINCRNCGAPNEPTAENCQYCEAVLKQPEPN